MFYHITKRMLL